MNLKACLLSICSFCVVLSPVSRGVEEAPLVTFPEFHVVDCGATIRWEADRSGRISGVTVTEVVKGSMAWSRGLRKGDSLQALNHRPVVGMARAEYLSLIEAPLTPSDPKVFSFRMARGFIVVRSTTLDITISLTAKKALKPNQPSDTTLASPAG